MRIALICLLAWSAAAFALRGPCSWRELANLWTREEPILVIGPSGEQPVTFSHDTEIPNGQAYLLMQKLPEFAQFKKELEHFRFTIAEIAALTGQSEEVVRKHAFLPDAKDKGEPYSLFDLDMWAFSYCYTKLLKKPDDDLPGLDLMRAAIERHLHEKGFRVKVTVDQHMLIRVVELQHESYDPSPRKFREEMDRIAEEIPDLKPHFHLGMPAFIPKERAVAIARATEVHLVLGLATLDPKELEPLKFNAYSPLQKGGAAFGDRGLVKLELNEFKGPPPAHDLEIRKYVDAKQAWTTTAFATELTRHFARLKLVPEFQQKEIADPYTQNLNGALRYASLVLEGTPGKANQDAAKQLKAFAEKIEQDGAISDATRAEVRQYLRRADILKRLKPAVFAD